MSKPIATISGITGVLDAASATRTVTGKPIALVICRRAVCDCGWKGHRRLTRAGAVLDVQLHSARTGCALARPLVWE